MGVDARGGTIKGETVCRLVVASSKGTPRRAGLVRESVRGPFTTEGVLGRFFVRSSPGVREAALACR